jgi:hypothetical protein
MANDGSKKGPYIDFVVLDEDLTALMVSEWREIKIELRAVPILLYEITSAANELANAIAAISPSGIVVDDIIAALQPLLATLPDDPKEVARQRSKADLDKKRKSMRGKKNPLGVRRF